MKQDTLIIAHRGESFDAPENTLASINLAWKRNINAVEIDIHMTLDQAIVVIHDDDTFRISGKKLKIEKSTLPELKQLDIGSHKDSKWNSERIPTLKQVLKTVPKNGRLVIEMKSDDSLLKKLKNELANSQLHPNQIELIAFNFKTLTQAKQVMPEYKMRWLLDLDYFWPWWMPRISERRIIRKLRKQNLDGVDVWAGKLLNRNFISAFKNSGLSVYAWTVDEPEKVKSLIADGVDGITTNRAGWIVEQIHKDTDY